MLTIVTLGISIGTLVKVNNLPPAGGGSGGNGGGGNDGGTTTRATRGKERLLVPCQLVFEVVNSVLVDH